jgi:hypothetical protein
MLDINNIGADAMIHTRDHQTSYLLVPSDPAATYDGHKGQGYQVQVIETCCDAEEDEKREQTLNLITHVAVERACKHDVHALIPALESAREGILPLLDYWPLGRFPLSREGAETSPLTLPPLSGRFDAPGQAVLCGTFWQCAHFLREIYGEDVSFLLSICFLSPSLNLPNIFLGMNLGLERNRKHAVLPITGKKNPRGYQFPETAKAGVTGGNIYFPPASV